MGDCGCGHCSGSVARRLGGGQSPPLDCRPNLVIAPCCPRDCDVFPMSGPPDGHRNAVGNARKVVYRRDTCLHERTIDSYPQPPSPEPICAEVAVARRNESCRLVAARERRPSCPARPSRRLARTPQHPFLVHRLPRMRRRRRGAKRQRTALPVGRRRRLALRGKRVKMIRGRLRRRPIASGAAQRRAQSHGRPLRNMDPEGVRRPSLSGTSAPLASSGSPRAGRT